MYGCCRSQPSAPESTEVSRTPSARAGTWPLPLSPPHPHRRVLGSQQMTSHVASPAPELPFTPGCALAVVHSVSVDRVTTQMLVLTYHVAQSHCPRHPLCPAPSSLLPAVPRGPSPVAAALPRPERGRVGVTGHSPFTCGISGSPTSPGAPRLISSWCRMIPHCPDGPQCPLTH